MKNGVKRVVFLSAVLILLLYTVAGFWILPSLASKKIPPILSETLGTAVSFDEISFNPYTMEMKVPDINVKDREGKNLLHLQEIYLNFSPLDSLLTLTLQIEALRFKRAVVNVDLESDGEFNFSNITRHLRQTSSKEREKSESDSSLPPIRLKQFAVESSEVYFKDFTTKEPVSVCATNLNFGIENLATLPGKKGTMVFTIETKNTAFVHSYSDISLNPLEVEGELVVSDAMLGKFDEYLKRYTHLGIPRGSADLFLSYSLSQAENGLEAKIDKSSFLTVHDFALKDAESTPVSIGLLDIDGISVRWPSREVSIGKVKLDDTSLLASIDEQGGFSFRKWVKPQKLKKSETAETKPVPGKTWHIGVGSVAVFAKAALEAPDLRIDTRHSYLMENISYDTNGSLHLPVNRMRIEKIGLYDKRAEKEVLGIQKAEVRNALLRMPQRRLDIESFRIEAPEAALTLFRDGETNLQRLFPKGEDSEKAITKERTKKVEGEPFRLSLERFAIDSGSVKFEDRTFEKPHSLSLGEIDMKMEDFTYPQKRAAPIRLSLKTPESGALLMDGTLLLAPLKSDMKLNCSKAALSPYLPYIQKFVNIDIPKGTLGFDASLSYDEARSPKAKIDYGVTVENLRIDHSIKKEKIFSLKELRVASGHLQLSPDNMKIEKILIEEPYASVHIAKDRSTNLDNLLKKSDTEPKKEPKSQKEEKSGQRFNFAVTKIEIKRGSSDFSDLSLPLPFKTHIHDLEGDALGIGNLPGSVAKVALKGIVERYGMAKIDATLITEDPLEKSEVDVDFRNLDVTNLSPYTGKYIGYAIKEGRLWMRLKYIIDKGKLESQNKIVLKKLELGEKIESNESIDAPIHLALALLKDSNGVIDLDIPIEGNVTDPKFKIGKVVWQAIGNMITGIVTAPFRFLGSILGIKGEELQYLNFEPGSDTIDPTQMQKLDRLTEALKQRPLLALKLNGVYHPKVDKEAIRKIKLKSIIIEKLGKKSVENIQNEVPLKLLETLYVERESKEALSKMKTAYEKRIEKEKKKPDHREYLKTLYTALLETVEVKKSELEDLAKSRAERISAYLLSKNIAKEQVVLGEPKSTEKIDETGLVPMKLELEAKKE